MKYFSVEKDGLDGAHERPGDKESSVTYKGEPLPYLPYAYRHPKYWQMIKKESKESGNMIASRKMFDESEGSILCRRKKK